MADLQELLAQRGYVKGSITRLFKFSQNDLSELQEELIREKCKKLAESFKEYEALNKKILYLCPNDKEDYNEVEEKYFTTVSTFNTIIATKTISKDAKPHKGEFKKLPIVNLTSFNGKNVVDYPPFINMFKSVIDADSRLSLCEKLHYLRSFLAGEALDVIKNLILNDENYNVALELLDNRYNNKILIINHHVNNILELPVVTKCTAQGLRSLVSVINLNLAALRNLKQPVEHWDTLLVNIVSKKVDNYTNRGFHQERLSKNIPKLSEFLDFLDRRAIAMENTTDDKSSPSQRPSKVMSGVSTTKPATCKYCQQTHKLYECSKFKLAPERERLSFVVDNKLCKVCLNSHNGKCLLKIKCVTCGQRHNTLLHENTSQNNASSNTALLDIPENNNGANGVALSSTTAYTDVLLPTAMVHLIKNDGTLITARALLDSGSQVSFITESLANNIRCNFSKTDQLVIGVCQGGKQNVSRRANFNVYSTINNNSVAVSCCVVKNITCPLPQQSFDISQFTFPSYVELADKSFNKTGELSLLLGCDIFFQVLRRESLPVTPSGPYLINTSFGYVVAGTLPITSGGISTSNHCLVINPDNCSKVCNTCIAKDNQLEQTILKFWECENIPKVYKEETSEHEQAEQIFQNSVKLENNRFSVALPLKVDVDNTGLGHSFPMALSRLHNLEKRFAKDINLFQQYKKFMSDYIQQGHAKYLDTKNHNLDISKLNFLPHHPVVNLNSKTTPVRAVFDGSAKTTNSLALNDILLNGPVVQSDLFDILTLFRTYKYVLLCDVKAMYRQVFLDEKHCSLQNILWRESRESPVKCIQLQTVTYGLKSSAFLATRCLIELAHKFKDQYPLAAFCLHNSSYVDDIQFGSDNIYELNQTKNELCKLLSMGGFALHKWCANDISLLKDIPDNLHQLDNKDFDKNCSYVKTLGLMYNVKTDTLEIQCPVKELKLEYTKREMLSFISKFFDPLGLVGPILVLAKLLMQEVWFHNIRWDQLLPSNINKKWVEFAQDLINMPCIAVPRNIKSILCNSFELVGFSDASGVAYGCCLYLRVIGPDKCVNINLFCSKSRINPKNKALTIPRLELESALLLAVLSNKVNIKLSLKYNVRTHLYSDSKIVLAWLKTEPVKLNMYVANRIKKIQQLTSSYEWNYVNTADNPADCLSRGVSPSSLKDNLLWWHGPKYMGNAEFVHGGDPLPMPMEEIPEIKPAIKTSSNICVKGNMLLTMLEKYSDIEKITRIMAYVLRFVNICKAQHSKSMEKLSPRELDSALQTIIRLDQGEHFKSEIQCLQAGNSVKSNLSNLNPFLDSCNLLRVGGRLQNADLPFTEMHPIILAKSSNVTKGIIWRQHIQLKHAGQGLVLSSLSEKYWIINASREIKSVLYKCIICFKLKAKNATQLMGSLPLDRVNMTRPFQIVGTDYGGPFCVKQTRIRNPVITKAYIVLFVCFVTKAIHIELASDMSTKTFLGCLKRFISRRNKPTKIYCDNGACYKGAANVLKELYDLQASTSHQDTVLEFCNTERITFHFIPSYSPVFGGLWEAGIKSVKYHMKRVIGNTVLTYEELYTVIVQIEGILNSRPLTPLSRDPDDMSYLTPGHFLTGSALSSYPELDLSNVHVGRLSFWQQCEQMQQLFWKKWHKYYLVLLQNRPKWKSIQPNLKPGNMVILKYDNINPLNWPVGRILNTMPGKDGCVRALEIKTAKGSVIRTSVTKVCPFPINED